MLVRHSLLAGEEQTAQEAAAELPPIWEGVRRAYLTGLVVCGAGQSAAAAGIAWFTPHLLDATDPRTRGVLAASLLLAALLVGTLRWAEWVLAEMLGQHYVLQLRRLLVATALRPGRHSHLGVLVARTTNDLSAIRSWVAMGIAPLVSGIPLLVGVVLALAFMAWELAVAVASALLIMAALLAGLSRPVLRRSRELRRRRGRMASHIADTVQAAPTIRAAGGEQRELKKVDEHSTTVRQLAVRRARLAGVMRGGAASVAVIAMVLAGVTSPWTDLTPARFATALLLVGLIATPVQDLGRVGEYRQGFLAASLVLAKALRRGQPPGAAPAATTSTDEDRAPARSRRRRGSTRGLLHVAGLRDEDGMPLPDLLAVPGSRIHLRSADSERVDHVLRTLVGDAADPDGWVQLDGWDLSTAPAKRRRRLLGYVAADVPLEAGRLVRAVRYRRPDSDRSIAPVLEAVGLTEVVANLPRGERTTLRRGGEPLTREQRILVQLARGLYCTPRLLVLDGVHDRLSAAGKEQVHRALADYPGIVVTTGAEPPADWQVWELDSPDPLHLVRRPTGATPITSLPTPDDPRSPR
ncbi:ABC transporter transmembrane domain-containing protein [Kytococcus sp. Marseille-QA3725]